MTRLRITPIGTCRIHTPLRRAVARYPIELDLRRNYGFVHTSDEALQLLRFLQGEKSFRAETAPLVIRDGNIAQFEAESWEPADLHIVEISSAKRIMSGSDAVQGNYVQRHFPDFFASNERSRTFWSLLNKGDRRDLILFLRDQSAYHLLSEDDRALLASLSMELQSFKTIKNDMAEIIDRLGRDHVLFVTHVNAATPDEALIPTRDRLIRWVKLAAGQLEAQVFDPTPLMEEIGQEQAMEDGGLDLTHYTLPFSDRLYDAIHQDHVAPLISDASIAGGAADAVDQRIGQLAARIEVMIDTGDFFAGSRDLFDALERHPEAVPLIELRGLVRSRIGDFSGALADLSIRQDDALLSQSMRVGLLEAMSERGLDTEALRVAQSLLAEEIENGRIYRAAALAAERAGRVDLAARYAKQAFRLDNADLSTGLHALRLLVEKGNAGETGEWRRELLERMGKSTSGAFEIATWALSQRDDELFSAALSIGAGRDKVGTIDLAEDAFQAGMMRAVAHALPIVVGLGRLAPGLADRRTRLIDKVVEQVAPLYEGGQGAEAFALARALLRVGEISNSQVHRRKLAQQAKHLIREITLHVRSGIRAAHAAGQTEEIIRLGNLAGEALLADPDTATIVARALNEVGRPEEALALLKTIFAENPDSFNARRWTGRIAGLVGDYATALDAYGGLQAVNPASFETVKSEVQRFYATVERRSLKQLRALADADRDEAAIELAEAIGRHLGPLDRIERETGRLFRKFRLQLKQIEEGEGDLEDREPILRLMTRIRPEEPSTLRLLALDLMRQFRFSEAASAWERLHQIDPNNESADRNRVRCVTLAKRRASVSNTERSDVG